MRFTTTLNNQKCMEWNLNATQGILVALLYESNSWAKEIIIEDKVYYFVSRNLVLQELPMFFEKADTVYRTLKTLAEKEIIEYIKYKNMDLIRLTEKGKTWNFIENNSEKNPSKLGKKSENNSEKNPTYKDTIYHKDINNNNNSNNNNNTGILLQEIKMILRGNIELAKRIIKLNKPISRIKEVADFCNFHEKGDGWLYLALKEDWELAVQEKTTNPDSIEAYLQCEEKRKESKVEFTDPNTYPWEGLQ